jgi:hypothetical protein
VADRLVLAELQPKEIAGVASGDLSFDALVRTYIHQHLTYRYIAFEGLTVTDYHSRVVGRHKRRWVASGRYGCTGRFERRLPNRRRTTTSNPAFMMMRSRPSGASSADKPEARSPIVRR